MATLNEAPRPGLPRQKSGTIQIDTSFATKMIRWRDAVIAQAQLDLQSYTGLQEAERYIDYLSGNWWNPNRPAYRSQFYDNHLADVRRESIASLTDIRPTIDVSCSVPAYEKQAQNIHGYIGHLWDEEDLDLKVADWVDHALFGTGLMKLTASEPGKFAFNAYGLDRVIPVLMEDNDLQTSAAVIYRVMKPLSYFQAKFGEEKCQGLERQSVSLARSLGSERFQRPDSIPEYQWSPMSPAMKRRMSMRGGPIRQAAGGYTPFPVLELLEIYVDDWTLNGNNHEVLIKHPDLSIDEHNYHYIVPPGRRLFPRKRLVVFAGDRVMYDGPAPNWHGQYPFIMLQLNPCVWSPGGIAKYRDLIPLVQSLNTTGAGIDEAVKRALNGTWTAKRGSISEAAWDQFQPGKPGQKVMLNPVAQANDFREIAAPSLPSQVDMWSRYVLEQIKRRSGSVDIDGMSKKLQNPGADTISQMQDVKSGPFRMEGRYVEAAIRRAGKQTASNIIQYVTTDQRVRVLGGDALTWADFDYKAGSMVPASHPLEDFWQLFSIKIAPGSSHGNSKFARKVTAMNLFKMGALSLRGLFRQLEFNEPFSQIMDEIAEERAAGVGSTAPAGRQQRMTRGERTGNA